VYFLVYLKVLIRRVGFCNREFTRVRVSQFNPLLLKRKTAILS
jgi:hypothetical protein